MNKEEYSEALKSPHWIKKRNIIKKRDGYKCVKCGRKDNLQVHHTYYLEGRNPWDVPNDCLITLCGGCHKKAHKGRDIKSFYRKNPPKLKLVKSIKTEKKVETKTITKKPKNEKQKKLRLYRFIALKSTDLKQVYDKTTDRREVSKLCKTLNGVLKGFDDKNLAERWLKQRDKKPTKRERRLISAQNNKKTE